MASLNDTLSRLKDNHVSSSTTEETNVCPICHGSTWITTKDSQGRFYSRPCECRERVIAETIMRSSGIIEEDRKKGFRDFKTFDEDPLIAAKETAIRYFRMFKNDYNSRINSLLLSGASGRGKTLLGLAVANNLIRIGIGVMYVSYRDTITELKHNIVDEYVYNEKMRRLKNAKVLFIDDLLKGKITESDINILYEIINYRYLQRLPLIISTEKTIPELISFDEAIASRIIEMSKDYTVFFDRSVPNYRLR